MSTYTVFCREANDTGTTWVGNVEAEDVEQAKTLGIEACADDWGGWDPEDIAVLGVAKGNVDIVFFDYEG